jgi:protein involved in sex pheromone biosynthesis
MKKTIYILAAALALLSSCGDSLEDTYKEFAGDGPI